MKKGYFITGTDTGVGKTFVASLIAAEVRERGLKAGVMKPVETGCKKKGGSLIPADALRLKKAARSDDPIGIINPYRFAAALAPSVAARNTRAKIGFNRIKECLETLSGRNDVMIVEGAGGLLTPLTEDRTILDLILFLRLPAIIVAASRLGCINSTLLTYGYAVSSGVTVAGVILNNPDGYRDESSRSNRGEIERLGVPLKEELPFLKQGERDKRLRGIAGSMLFKPGHGILCS
ncbi:MAG: dethiobiotin synthase [Deltaproteobacteria bacterium]|nr:dethiobiotin synthase [Deltaproteobacteria bacterium]